MDEIPDVWPPEEDPRPAQTIPMFPLQGVFLLPRQILPLHVFEPRYRQMIDDVLDGQGRLAMGTVLEGQSPPTDELEGIPPRVLHVAGVGEIARHEKTPDGRYFIWLFGIGRFDVEEVPSDRLYRQVKVRPLEETEIAPGSVTALTHSLREALDSRSESPLELPEDVPPELLADALAQRLHLPQSAMEPIFAEPDVARRARMTLKAHAAFPKPDLDD
ncbi:Lon protease [Planctomycetes bacterium Poly30]|uniref:Lon protease n=1 Tax=Saltatorellus ferox TaxID=2528018 RepID=A0A518EY22_9BACT|nr:Lon protease [Planctomycetes bacterium Poly30]